MSFLAPVDIGSDLFTENSRRKLVYFYILWSSVCELGA